VLTHDPDVSVVDVRMPPTYTDEGLRAAITARSQRPGAPMLVLSQYVEVSYAGDLLADGSGAVGYRLKDRVARVAEFLDALDRVARGEAVLDPQVIAQLLAGQRRDSALAALTARERELLALMAEGHSNTAIARRLVLPASAVEKHIGNVFAKLGLPPDEAQHRRVLADLASAESGVECADSRTAAPVLVIGNRWDPVTSYGNAVKVARLLPSSRLISSDSWGHTALLTSACVDDTTWHYLIHPLAPAPKITHCRGDVQPFAPSPSTRVGQ
jgi:DNA-binding NarL/FixJ family response regulator